MQNLKINIYDFLQNLNENRIFPLRLKIFIVIFSLIGAVLSFIYLLQIPNAVRENKEFLTEIALDEIKFVADSLAPDLLRDNLVQTWEKLEAIKSQKHTWEHLELYDADSKLIYPQAASDPSTNDYIVKLDKNITFSSERLATLKVWVNLKPQLTQLNSYLSSILTTIIITGLISLALFLWWIDKIITKPVTTLTEATKKILDENFEINVFKARNDEIGELFINFANMAHEIQQSQIASDQALIDITERVNAERSLHLSQQRLIMHREQSPMGIVEWNPKFEVVAWNPAAENIFGYSKEEVMGKYILDWILPENARPVVDDIWKDLLENKGGSYSVNENITKDGRTILCEWHNTPLVDDEGNVIGVSVIVDDITEKQKKEENERQMLKMDAIGKLTGGIAHDFNNMLGVILGFSGLLKKSLDGDNPKQIKYCDQILKAGDRAKKLTSNLLEFSSTAPSSVETIDINILLSEMEHMLETTFTARIRLILELEDGLWPICLDKARLEDAILNMGINAMHAMPDGGKLTMNSSTRHLVKKQSEKLGLLEGDYVVLSITDTGSGMPPEVQQKIFDPFFTTKGTEGTGLGLSQVYGFVQQAGGTIDVSSKVGCGTTLTLYFPRCVENEVIKTEDEAAAPMMLQQSDDTILVVDDEDALLLLNEDILTAAGYNVLVANGAEQALKMLKDKRVDLILSDVIMPEVNGYQLAAEVKKLYPEVKIQMVSGYSEDHNKNVASNKLYQQRLHKPVDADTLLHRVIERLDKTG